MAYIPASDLIALVRAGLADGLNLAAERVRAEAVPRTPLEYGDLRSSLAVEPATESNLESRVVSDLPYSVVVHEDLTAYHDDGEAKFLELAANESRDDVGDIIGTSIRRRLPQ